MNHQNQSWSEVIKSEDSLLKINLKELIEYKDLMFMFVKRDFAATFKQTILGPLWFIIQPVITTIIFTIVFGKYANMKTDVEPKLIFYFSGLIIWNYFSECFTKISSVFKDNTNLFGKVYFPRLIIPLSIVLSGLIRFLIQYILFIIMLVYFSVKNDSQLCPSIYIILTPLFLLMMAGLALGSGLIIAALTTKYRDLSFLISFGVQLLMYCSPIIYSTTKMPIKYKNIVNINPLSSIIESFRNVHLGIRNSSSMELLYSFIFTVFILLFGIFYFNKVEKRFIDTV